MATARENGREHPWSQLYTTGDIVTAVVGNTFAKAELD